MVGVNDIVITGIGCVSAVGIGREAMWQSLQAGRCGIRNLATASDEWQTTFYGAAVDDFDAKEFVRPRKALKVMSREVQLAYSAAQLAWQDAQLGDFTPDPDRLGVVYGSEMIPGDHMDLVGSVRACSDGGQMDFSAWGQQFSKHIFPLWMLRNLPNMPACHVGIAVDARGPNNTIAQEEVSSLLAIYEAMGVIERGAADLMLVGAVGSRITPTRLMYRAKGLYDEHPLDSQRERCLPFDARRRGIVPAEGAGTLLLERRSHAVRRGAKIYGVVSAAASRCGIPSSLYGGSAKAIADAATASLRQAELSPDDLSHISAQGYSEQHLDQAEATAIGSFAAHTPVTAYSSYFGTAGAACGMLELIGSLLAGQSGQVLPTLGFRQPDPQCPVSVCQQVQAANSPNFLKLSFTPRGHAAAVVVQCTN